MKRHTPYYLGSRAVNGLTLPTRRIITINGSKWMGRAPEAVFKIWNVAPGLYSRLAKLQPVLMHAHFGPDGACAMSLSKSLKIPLLVTFHGYDVTVTDLKAMESFVHRAYPQKKNQLIQQGRLFIAVSEFIKKRLIEQGFPPDSIIVHYIGVDTDFFQPEPAVQREPVVLFRGRLIENKGCEYAIKAMSKVQTAMPDVKFVVVGDGPLRLSLERLAASMLKSYTFLGTQPHLVIRNLMNRAKVFCVPSVTIRSGASEGFGMVFAEAQAMGLPVVSFQTGGIPEAVSHGETGFLAPERDWDGLAEYILCLMKNKELWHQFSNNGQKRIRERFNLIYQTGLLEDIYDKVLQGELFLRGNNDTEC